MRALLGVILLAAAVAGVVFLNETTRDKAGNSVLHVAREKPVEVETARPRQRDIVRTVQAPGEVEAVAEVDISSEVMGKIVALPVEEGQRVEEGDLLCRLDAVDFEARVRSAAAQAAKLAAMITQAEADLEKAERDYGRQQRFMETQVTSENELANYRTVLIGARALLEVRKQERIEAEAMLENAREDLAKTVITAPISGVVSQLFAEQGEVVITGTMNNLGTRVMVVSDLSSMQVRCRIDETDAPLVKPGQTARIYLQSDTRRSIAGRVLRVATKGTKQLGRDVVTFETLALITDDDERVKPGMTANVEIEVAQEREALTLPAQAVVYRKRRDLPEALLAEHDTRLKTLDPAATQNIAEYIKLVFCVEGEQAVARLVETGISDATGVQVTRGVASDDKVIVGPYRALDQLREGCPVKLEEARPQDDSEKAATSQPSSGADQLAANAASDASADGAE